MSSRRCINPKDTFCYVCGLFTDKRHRKSITSQLKKAYEFYFDSKVDIGKSWAPSMFCSICANTLSGWLRKSITHSPMPFGMPMIWREPNNHVEDCYFCLTKVLGFNFKTRKAVTYPNINSVSKPFPHDPITCPVPKPPLSYSSTESPQDYTMSVAEDSCSDSDYRPDDDEVHLINYDELCDLVRDLALTKGQAEVLGSRLKQFNLLTPGTLISTFRHRHKDLVQYFGMNDSISYCKDVDGLLSYFGYEHKADEWRLFIDASKTSLKAVLLHNGNKFSSLPLAYAAHMKETYDNMVVLLDKIRYRDHNWHICADFKVIAILMGMQGGM